MVSNNKLSSLIGLFMIMLVLSLPFYSANALAAIQITKNTGQKGIPNFIDAVGDTWTVEATLTDVQNVQAKDVKLVVSDEREFQSCANGPSGTVCTYTAALQSGMTAKSYNFNVAHKGTSTGSVVHADGSAPKITFTSSGLRQVGNSVGFSFLVDDRVTGQPCVGIDKVEIIDAESKQVLHSINEFSGCEFEFSEVLPLSLSGEGRRNFQIKAVDKLGHSRSSSVVGLSTDFVQPKIFTESIAFDQMGKFVGPYVLTTDIKIDVGESSDLRRGSVIAFSEQADFEGEAQCEEDEQVGLWHCEWSNVEVEPVSSISVKVTATDESGNRAEATSTKSFTSDTSKPELEFFGTDRVFDGESYIRNGKNTLILRARDLGAGISGEGIKANLGSFGRSSLEGPTECALDEGVITCLWRDLQFSGNTNQVVLGLSKFEDKVGNEGAAREVELNVDNSGPVIEVIDIFGSSAVGDKDYLQSNDVVKIVFTAIERAGIVVLVNGNGLINDAETQFPVGYKDVNLPSQAGWQVFDTESCQQVEQKWECIIETAPIMSGPDSSVKLEFKIQDTAGNDAGDRGEWLETPKSMKSGSKGNYKFDLLGLDSEESPDYWEVARTRLVKPFVDLDVTPLIPASIPVEISLRSSNSRAAVINVETAGCSLADGETGPELSSRSKSGGLLYGGVSSTGEKNPKPKLVLEFETFDGREIFGIREAGGNFKEAEAKYVCQLRVYSKLGRNAIETAELQEVDISVKFAFSKLGAVDENLAKRIQEMRDDGWRKFADAIAVLDTVFKWIQYIGNFINIVVQINVIVDMFSDRAKEAGQTFKPTPGVGPTIWGVLSGTCLSAQIGQSALWEVVEWLQVPVQILSCSPGALDTIYGETDSKGNLVQGSGLGWYGAWQANVLNVYNLASGRDLLGVPANSLYENMYTSILGLCVPGIVFNVNKAREIHCRKEICYGQDVPRGLATIDACNDLYDLQMCEFFWGPAFDFVGLGGLATIGKMIQSAFTSPLGLISLTETLSCGALCLVDSASPDLLTTCKVATTVNKAIGIVDSIVSSIDNTPNTQGSPYCDQAENIDLDALMGKSDFDDTFNEPEVPLAETEQAPVEAEE
jgi:hypothetical protein